MAAVPSLGRATGIERRAAPGSDATRLLYERYSRQIFAYCLHQLSSREEAEDAVQTTFMNAFRGLQRGIVPEMEQAWLFKIAENVCLSRRRSSWRRGRVESPNDFQVLQEIVPSRSQTSNVELIGLEDALAAMPENQRRAILLREWQGLSYREIADELEVSQSAVETLIFRARRTLAQGLEEPEPKKKRRLAGSLNFGSLLAGLKTLFTSGVAVKAVAIAAVATVAATKTEHTLVVAHHHVARTAPQQVNVTPQAQAAFNAPAAIVSGATGMPIAHAHRLTHPVSLHDAFAGHGRAAVAPAEEPSRTSSPPPAIPLAPAATAPVEQPQAPAVAPTPPPAPTPAVTDNGRGNGGDNKGNDNAKRNDPAPAASSPAAPATPAQTPAATDNGKGNGGDNKGNDKKDDPAPAPPVATPTPPAATGNGNGNGNDPKGQDKKDDPAPSPVVTPASQTQLPTQANGNGNGNGNDAKDNKGQGKKDDPAPAPPAVDPPAPATPVATTTVAAPPTPPTNPPMHGNGNGGQDKPHGNGK